MAKSRQGFTLMEIIIYVGIMGMVMSALMMFALSISNNRDKSYSASEVEANSKIVLREIGVLVRSARAIDEANSVFDNDQGKLALFLGPDKTLPATITLEAGRVKIKTADTTEQFVSSQAVSFSMLNFTKLSDDMVSVKMFLAFGPLGAEITREKSYDQIIKTSFTLRK